MTKTTKKTECENGKRWNVCSCICHCKLLDCRKYATIQHCDHGCEHCEPRERCEEEKGELLQKITFDPPIEIVDGNSLVVGGAEVYLVNKKGRTELNFKITTS